MVRTFYEVLEVPADASQAAITDAYREKVKEYHPDVSDLPDARERFKRVKRAEEVLGDPEERAIYDELGHESYVDGFGSGSAGASDDEDESSTDDVRAAAARAAAGSDDAGGGRSAGWRDRERRARQRRAEEWFGGATDVGVGFDADDPGRRWTYRPPGEDGDDAERGSRRSTAGAAGADATGAAAAGVGATATSGTASARSARGRATADPHGASDRAAAGGRASTGGPAGERGRWADPERRERHAATEMWGNRERATSAHAVHDWSAGNADSWIPRPGWSQDDVVLLFASLLLYPIMLFTTVVPAVGRTANVAMGVVTFAFVVFLLPRPAMGLPVFGTWSVAMPALLLGLGVPLLSLVGFVTLVGVWIPFLYSLALAIVLVR